jgi:hypothetical protein
LVTREGRVSGAVSGPKTASYQISAAELARLREQERLSALRRRWQALQERHRQLQLRAERLHANYGFTAPVIEPLAEVGSLPADGLETALTAASDVVSQSEVELGRQERLARDTVARAMIAGIVQPPPPSPPVHDRVDAACPAPVPAVSDVAVREKDLAKTVTIMAKLDPEIEPPAQLTELVTAIAQANAGQRRILLNQLGADVAALNADARVRQAAAEAIAEAERVAQDTDDRELCDLVTQTWAAHRERGVVDLAAMRAAVDTALRRAAAEREREFVEQVVIEAFEALDCEVLTGFEVRTPEAGALVRRDSAGGHAFRAVIRDRVLEVQAVRIRRDPPPSRAEDRRAEEQLCAIAPKLWGTLKAKGVEINGVSSVPVGREVPSFVDTVEHSTAGPPQRRRKNPPSAKERYLR